MSKNRFLQRIEQGTVLCAEGYLFELERRGYVSAGPFVPEVSISEPEAVRQLHRDFLRAGAEIMVAFTYYAHRRKLRDIGKEDILEDLNRAALRIAKEVAQESDALVAGNICNTWEYNPADEASYETVREMYREQVQWALDAGVDLVIAETYDYYGEAALALEVIKEFDLPAVVTFAPKTEKTFDGLTWVEACQRLEADGAEVVGVNCARGPLTMLPILQQIRDGVDCHVAAQPVPYRTTEEQPHFQILRFEDGNRAFPVALDPFQMTRFEMAEFAIKAQKMGVDFIGICCGGAPHHVRAMAEALGRTTPASQYSPDMSLHPVLGEKGEDYHGTDREAWEVQE